MAYEASSLLVIDGSPLCRSIAALPAMQQLRITYSQAFLAIAASRATGEILAPIGIADELIDLGVVASGDSGGVTTIKRFVNLIRQTRHHEYHLVLDFSPSVDTSLASHLGRSNSRVVTPAKVVHFFESLLGRSGSARFKDHAVECASVLNQIGVKVEDPRSPLVLPSEENHRFEELLSKHGSRGGEPVVVLFGSGSNPRTNLVIDCLADVAVRLERNFGARIVVVDEPLVRGFSERIGRLLPASAIRLVSPRALEMAAVIARASLVITGEGELINVAEVFGTPMIEISHRPPPRSTTHRVVQHRRGAVLFENLFDAACELMQTARSSTLFRR